MFACRFAFHQFAGSHFILTHIIATEMWTGVVEEQPCQVVNLTQLRKNKQKHPDKRCGQKLAQVHDVDIRPTNDIDAATMTVCHIFGVMHNGVTHFILAVTQLRGYAFYGQPFEQVKIWCQLPFKLKLTFKIGVSNEATSIAFP